MEEGQETWGGRWMANTKNGLLPVQQAIMGWLASLDPIPTSLKANIGGSTETKGIKSFTGDTAPQQLIAFLDGEAFPPSIHEASQIVMVQGFEFPDYKGKSFTRTFHCACPADAQALAALARASAPASVMGPAEMQQFPLQAMQGVNITLDVSQVLQICMASQNAEMALIREAWRADMERFGNLKDLVFEIGRMHAMDGPRMHLELAKLQSEERKDLAQMNAITEAKARQDSQGLWLQGFAQVGGILERAIDKHPEHAGSFAKGIEGIGAAAAKIAGSGG